MTAVQAAYVLLLLLLPCCAARDSFPAIVVNAPPAPRAPPRPASAATSALPPRAPPMAWPAILGGRVGRRGPQPSSELILTALG